VDVDNEVPRDIAVTPEILIPPTSSGRQRKFPRRSTDYLPSLSVRLPHMPERPRQQMRPTQPDESQRSRSPSPSIYLATPGTDGAMSTFDTEPDE
jgi:hypothetical protein